MQEIMKLDDRQTYIGLTQQRYKTRHRIRNLRYGPDEWQRDTYFTSAAKFDDNPISPSFMITNHIAIFVCFFE
jgi:hypothetical protein